MPSYERQPTEIPENAIFTVTSGVYSDYSVSGVFRALRSFIDLEVEELFMATLNADDRRWNWASRFLAWLTVNNYIEDVPSFELHVDDNYGRHFELNVTKYDAQP